MAKTNAVIIKRVKKGGHAHHGGAWKVAYADFVTAMMAFFLLLWLLNATTQAQKRGIADYFAPTVASKSTSSGAGGLLGGRTMTSPGAQVSSSAPPGITVSLSPPQTDEDDDQDEPPQNNNPKSPADVAEAAKMLAAHEEKKFQETSAQLKQAIQQVPDLKILADSLVIDRTDEGLRIQLVDQEKASMFPLGSADMSEPARKLMTLVSQAVQKLPNKLSISGHTDATPFTKPGSYTNWELSTDRANASRRALVAGGLPADRISTVIGKADTDNIIPDPNSPRNRRISIVLLREAPVPPPAAVAKK
ncbi:MAG TPA: flagellar motor protein MotB [Stellaceae bacterium]|nr:flagellar motor protein MotB [Stellaceae bacterium]